MGAAAIEILVGVQAQGAKLAVGTVNALSSSYAMTGNPFFAAFRACCAAMGYKFFRAVNCKRRASRR